MNVVGGQIDAAEFRIVVIELRCLSGEEQLIEGIPVPVVGQVDAPADVILEIRAAQLDALLVLDIEVTADSVAAKGRDLEPPVIRPSLDGNEDDDRERDPGYPALQYTHRASFLLR
jgi:hypothetical protein